MEFKLPLRIYFKNIESVLLISIIVLLPALLFHNYVTSVSYYIAAIYDNPFFGDMTNILFLLLLFMICQIPFIAFTFSEMEDEENKLKKSFGVFLKFGFSVFLFAILYTVLSILGLLAFVIPGILIMVFLFPLPYITVLKDQPIRKVWRTAFLLAKKHFFKLLMLLVSISLIEMLLGYAVNIGISFITQNTLAFVICNMLINLLLFPLLIIIISANIKKWYDMADFYSGKLQSREVPV
ncbi:hypothetical protein AAEO50_15300 [Rossellomorea oryzaecorticis]|uniref:Glycerophosphoryl diester phosphodiesterase membrane domain-containing protein n=1 Tax=Rossellomorea oryzaecorticis TaxID=1396505 RepID=A0ABU9KE29_9BACI